MQPAMQLAKHSQRLLWQSELLAILKSHAIARSRAHGVLPDAQVARSLAATQHRWQSVALHRVATASWTYAIMAGADVRRSSTQGCAGCPVGVGHRR